MRKIRKITSALAEAKASRRQDEFKEPDANSFGSLGEPGSNQLGSSPLVGGDLSYQATGWVLEFSESELGARLVLLALSYRMNNETGVCFPSLDTIAKECRMTRQGVIQAIKRLEESRELVVDRVEKPGSGSVNKYRMPIFSNWWAEAKLIPQRKKSKPALPLENEERVNAITEKSKPYLPEPSLEPSSKEREKLLPLEKEERKALPKPVRELKARKGVKEYSRPASATAKIVTNKQPESFIWFAKLFKHLSDVNAYDHPGMFPLVDEMLAEIDKGESEERLSIYIDGATKITGWLAKSFLEGGWRTVNPEDNHMRRLVAPEDQR